MNNHIYILSKKIKKYIIIKFALIIYFVVKTYEVQTVPFQFDLLD